MGWSSEYQFVSTTDASVLPNKEGFKLNKTEGFQLQEDENKETSMDNERRQMLCNYWMQGW